MTKRSKDILIPSEEYTLEVHPLDFEEFLWARADTFTMPLMREHFDSKKPMGALHQSMMRSFREYMLVGGMPQVVQAFINGKDYGAADSEKQRILSFWQDGMREQSKENCDYLQAFFAHIPSELMRRNKRYVISHATPNARWREYEKPIHWLEASMMIDRVCALENIDGTDDFAVADPVFRCYLSDTGLLVSLACFLGSALFGKRALQSGSSRPTAGQRRQAGGKCCRAVSEGKRTPGLLLCGTPSGNQKDHDGNRLFDSARQKDRSH